MLTRFTRMTAAVLSGVTASLLVGATTTQAAQSEPVVVYGEPQENLRSERVSFADLELATAQGEKRLMRRVGSAVRRVCLYEPGLAAALDDDYSTCADGAWDGARPQIAQAVARAKEIALTGQSSIAATAITVGAPGS